MSEIISGKEYHDPLPAGSDRSAVQQDAPALIALFDDHPGIHIYTSSNSEFPSINKFRFERTDITPLAIVRPTTETEISAIITACATANVPVAVRSGGNDMSERSRVDGGVVIDVRSMDTMTIAADRKSVRLGGGINSGKLSKFLDENGLDTPVGWDSEVGYVAWACGGGYGLQCGSRGLGVDQVLGGRIVTASGDVLDVQDKPGSEDALWALRGGGAGVMGVVSELTVKVYPTAKALAGFLMFPYAEAEKVFGNMQKIYQEDLPDNFAGELILVDPMGNGGAINHFFWWELKGDGSDVEKAKEYYKKITECGTVIMDTVKDPDDNYNQTTQHAFLESIKNPGIKTRQMCYVTTLSVPSFSAPLGAIFARHPLPTTISGVVVHHCHGRGAVPDPALAFGNRERHLLLGIMTQCSWDDEETKRRAGAWSVEVRDEIMKAGLNTPWKYINFSPREKGDGKMYLGEDGVRRMKEIKKRFDPKGLFANNTPDLDD